MERLCITCGRDISHRHPSAIRCEECAAEAKNNRIPGSGLSFNWEKPSKYAARCQKCFHYNRLGFCDFFYNTGVTRTSLHPGEPLNTPCKEFLPKEGSKNARAHHP